MTHKRINLLLIGLLFLTLATLILMPYCSHAAEDDIGWHLSGYGITNYAGSKYYSQGFGGLIEGQAKWRFVELYGSGKLLSQKKKTADSGYVYGLHGQVRLVELQWLSLHVCGWLCLDQARQSLRWWHWSTV